MKRNILFSTLVILSLGVFFIACGDDDDDNTCDTAGMTYNNDIATILNTNCAAAACHSAADAGTNGSLATYNDAVAFVGQGSLVGAINHTAGFAPMPYPLGSDKLGDCLIDKIEAWITDGTPE